MRGSAEVGPAALLAATLAGLAQLAVLGEGPLAAPTVVLGARELGVRTGSGAPAGGPVVGERLIAEGVALTGAIE